MTVAEYLVDASAFVRLSRDRGAGERWRSAVGAGALAVCSVTELEILYSARSRSHRSLLKNELSDSYCWVVMPDRIFERAASVQELLTERGTHRSAGPVDLLVAATAEAHGLKLLHYDHDFEKVAEVTGQPTRWLTDPGSID